MDKERDVMINKLDRLNNHIKSVNKALDDLYYNMGEEETIQISMTEEEFEHVRNVTKLVQDKKLDFLDDDEFKVMIHSVVGES